MKGEATPLPLYNLDWARGGGAPRSFLLLLPSLFPIPCGRWNPTRTPHLGAPYEGRPPPPSILYIRGQGAPHRHTS